MIDRKFCVNFYLRICHVGHTSFSVGHMVHIEPHNIYAFKVVCVKSGSMFATCPAHQKN
jgi:hypothetical protein